MQKGIAYIEYNLAGDADICTAVMRESGREIARELIRRGGQRGVPVITIGDDIVVGFDETLLDDLLS